MSFVLDVGALAHKDVVAPLQLIVNTYGREADEVVELLIWSDVKAQDFSSSLMTINAAINCFTSGDLTAFSLLFSNADLISVYSPNYLGSSLVLWRIVAERDTKWEESIIDSVASNIGIIYFALTQDKMLYLDSITDVTYDNFPWKHWQLLSAKVTA